MGSPAARLSNPNKRAEAITTRPLLLHAIGRKTSHSNQTTLALTSLHAEAINHGAVEVCGAMASYPARRRPGFPAGASGRRSASRIQDGLTDDGNRSL
jgi:hypothetical protein